MFAVGTSIHLPRARELLERVASAISDLSNKIIVRGHTDSRGYKADDERNNWVLSSERADSTRLVLEVYGVSPDRFVKIEGYADTLPFVPGDLYDARNRRISVVLKYQARSK
jgi:chemotaxis protein MotB